MDTFFLNQLLSCAWVGWKPSLSAELSLLTKHDSFLRQSSSSDFFYTNDNLTGWMKCSTWMGHLNLWQHLQRKDDRLVRGQCFTSCIRCNQPLLCDVGFHITRKPSHLLEQPKEQEIHAPQKTHSCAPSEEEATYWIDVNARWLQSAWRVQISAEAPLSASGRGSEWRSVTLLQMNGEVETAMALRHSLRSPLSHCL